MSFSFLLASKKMKNDEIWSSLNRNANFIVFWIQEKTLRTAEPMLALPIYRKNCAGYNNKNISTLWTLDLFSILGRMRIWLIQYYRKFWQMSVIKTQKTTVKFSYISRNDKKPMYSDS